jgi:uncharacterized membrane protein YhaH (DUF805 family)
MLFSFEGRIRRSHWWLARLGVGFAWLSVLIVLAMIVGGLGNVGERPAAATAGAGLLGLVFVITLPLVFWIEFALTAKRWHDCNKPAVMVLIIFVPLIGGIWTLVECGFIDGTQGPNQYGPSPKGLTDVHVFT